MGDGDDGQSSRLQGKSSSDHALATIKALINLVPLVGGAIASLIGDYVPVSTQGAVERTIHFLGDKLTSLEARIDVDLVDKEEFSELFKSCYLVIIRSHREEKLRAAANLLANLLLRPGDPCKASYEELDHFVRCLDALSTGAISVLGAARQIAMKASSGGQGQFYFLQLRNLFPEFEASFLMSLVSELRGLNLLRVQERPIRTPDYGEVSLELTPIGRRFVDQFIEGNM
jgi:hypothetical protein